MHFLYAYGKIELLIHSVDLGEIRAQVARVKQDINNLLSYYASN